MTYEPWSPEDLFKPSKEYPQGSSGAWTSEENGVMVRKIYKDGKLVATEVIRDDVLEAAEKADFTKNEDDWSVTLDQAGKFYDIAFEAGRRLEAAQWLVDAED